MNRRNSITLVLLAGLLAACGASSGGPRDDAVFSRTDAVRTQCGSTSVKGIDVSSWQGSVNWSSVAGAGYAFAITRISDGTGYADPTFSTNWPAIKAHGMVRGAYQYFEPGESVSAQANMVVSAVGKLGPGDLPVTLDVETATPTASEVNTWVSIVEQGTGKKPMIYTSWGLWNGWFPNGGFENLTLWTANYGVSCPGLPNNWSSWLFWQYADNTSVPGISGNVDGDYFNGTLAQLKSFAGLDTCGGAADGYYCGGHGGVGGDPGTLYQCSGNQRTTVEACAGWCGTGPAGDFCARHHRPSRGPDLDGDGKADLCGRSNTGVSCWGSASGPLSTPITGPALSDASGWSGLPYYTSLAFADVNGDGKADLCGRGVSGAMCWLGNGSGFPTATAQGPLTDAAGWSKPEYRETIQWADVNGDGKADLCGRSSTSFSCWLSDGAKFSTQIDAPDMGDAQGWNEVAYYGTLVMADVNNDGKTDVCGRGFLGFECFLSTGTGFGAAQAAVDAFSDPNGGDVPSVFSTLQLADIDGDGKLDLCGRTTAGYVCFKGAGNGTFPTRVAGPPLSDAQGWGAPTYYSTIQLADINGDGKADVCGRGAAGIACWLSNGSGFPTQLSGPALSDAAGWNGAIYGSTLQFADVDGDGMADLCGRSASGWSCWLSTGNGFASSPITLDAASDSQGWNDPSNLTTLQLVGSSIVLHARGGSTGSGSGSTSGGSTSTTGTSGSTGTSGTTGTTGSSAGTGTTSGSGASSTDLPPQTSKSIRGGGCGSATGTALWPLMALMLLALRRRS